MATDLTWPITAAAVLKKMPGFAQDRVDELEEYAVAAVAAIERKVGPWHGQQLTHELTARTRRSAVVLPWPVASIDAVTLDDVALEPVSKDPQAGLVYLEARPGRIVVTATARPASSVPAPVILAGRALAVFWAKQELVGPRTAGNSRAGSTDTDESVLQGFALPRRVSEMIRDYVLPGGFA